MAHVVFSIVHDWQEVKQRFLKQFIKEAKFDLHGYKKYKRKSENVYQTFTLNKRGRDLVIDNR